jgi:hypothetical protein
MSSGYFGHIWAEAFMNGLTYSGDRLALARQFEQFAKRSNEPDETIDAFEAWLCEYVQPCPERG